MRKLVQMVTRMLSSRDEIGTQAVCLQSPGFETHTDHLMCHPCPDRPLPHRIHYRSGAVTFAIFSFSNVPFWIVSTSCIFMTLPGTILKVACYLIHLCSLRSKSNSLAKRVPWKGAPRHIDWGKEIKKKFPMSSVDLINWGKACSMLYLTGNPR